MLATSLSRASHHCIGSMASALVNDTDLRFPSVTVVSASAGSGKTYTLAQRFVQLLLSPRVDHNDLQNILAITFTNNAAAEMRQRVLSFLKKICLGDSETMADVHHLVELSDDALRERAAQVLTAIFQRYSDFQVRTIDSFMIRTFKASALELGFSPTTEILLDNRPLIAHAFDLFARDISEGSPRAALFDELARLIAEQERGERFTWDPYSRIGDEVQHLLQQLAYKTGTLRDTVAGTQARDLAGRLAQTAREITLFADSHKLQLTSYFNSDLQFAVKGEWRKLLGRTVKTKAAKSGTTKAEKEAVATFGGQLDAMLFSFNTLLGQLALEAARTHYLPYVMALREMRPALDLVRHQNNWLCLDDVTRALAGHLAEGTVPAVYFRLGETIYHYLIDEFQDTSPVQWSALEPLVLNSVANGGSLFVVGDTKQSIYGFRGADWRIMREFERGTRRFDPASTSVVQLQTNWRSTQRVVDFSKEVFQRYVPEQGLATAAALSGFDAYSQDVLEKNRGRGHVEVHHLERDDQEPPERMLIAEIVASARKRGYRYGDIAILTPANERVVAVSGWLNDADIPFVSHSSLDVRKRSITGEIFALLRFLDSPIDDLSFATFILGGSFYQVCREEFPDLTPERLLSLSMSSARMDGRHMVPLYKAFQKECPVPWHRFFERLFAVTGYVPLYDLVVEICKTFRFFELRGDEEGTLVKFLETAKDFEQTGNNCLKDFLEYAEEETAEQSAWDIEAPAGTDAVTLMTIHKAKGLQFPVVIVLLYQKMPNGDPLHFAASRDDIEILHLTKDYADKHPTLSAELEAQTLANNADELNRLYVALTRAKSEMYVLSVAKDAARPPACLLPAAADPPENRPAADVRPSPDRSLLTPYHGAPARRSGPADRRPIGFDQTRRGDYIHALLASLEYVDGDVTDALDLCLRSVPPSRLLGREEACAILGKFLRESGIANYFCSAAGRQVYNELDIVHRSGSLYRIDRLVLDGDSATVIDFKTGREEFEDLYRGQVHTYMDMVRDLFPGKTVRGVIAYVDRRHCVEVE